MTTRTTSKRTTVWMASLAGAWVIVSLSAGCEQKPSESAASNGETLATVSAPIAPVASSVGAQTIPGSCRRICDVSGKLGCKHASDCEPQCVALGSLQPCVAQVRDFYDCLLKQSRDHWECDEEGVPAIKEGHCDGQQAQALACLEHVRP